MKKSKTIWLGIGILLTVNSAITGYASQTRYPTSQKIITLNGVKVSSPSCIYSVDPSSKHMTTYIPVYSVMHMLQSLGMRSQWDGRHWNLQIQNDTVPDTSHVSLSSLPVQVSLNGIPVESENAIVSLDDASRESTTYIPLYYLGRLLQRLHMTSSWDGQTWAVIVPNRPMVGGKLTLDTDTIVRDLDPAKAYDTSSQSLVRQVYDTLLRYDSTQKMVVPEMAKSFEVSSDGLTYTFHLKEGMQFSNGDPVTATSFEDEFERVLSREVTSPGEGYLDPIVVGASDYFNQNSQTIRGVVAEDPHTLVIHLTQPEPFFLDVLTLPFFSAVDNHFIHQVGNQDFDTVRMMGSGPFLLSNVDQAGYTLKRNPNYWKKDVYGNTLPYLNQVKVQYQMNSNLAALHFEKGETGLLGAMSNGVQGDTYGLIANQSGLKSTWELEPENATYYLGMNTQIAPFNDPKFRKVLEYAINKQKIVQDILRGTAQVADQPIPPNMPGYISNLPDNIKYTYNPETARTLLSEAGYKPGETTVTFDTWNASTSLQIAEEVKTDLEQIGIHCNIQSMSWAPFIQLALQGKASFFELAWLEDYHDPSDFLNVLFNSNQIPMNNATNYSNTQVDAWLNKAQTDTNPDERANLYNQVTVQVMQDAVWVPLYYPEKIEAVQPWIHGYTVNSSSEESLEKMWIDSSHFE